MILDEASLSAIGVTLKLALVTTSILLLVGTPLAWWLSRSQWRFKSVLEAIIALPLVLPPTVLGFYLLMALGPKGFVGNFFLSIGLEVPIFSFAGLVIGSVIYSLPFVVQPLQASFSAVNKNLIEVASTLGASPLDTFFSVVLPICYPGFLTAIVLGFAHTVGEFGVVLMIGGNIPGETQVLSIAIYDHVEAIEYAQAHWLAGGLLLSSFVMLAFVYGINRRYRVRFL